MDLLKKYNLLATFFVTANFANKYPDLLKKLDMDGHEIASHGYDHSFHNQNINQIMKAKLEKEKIIGKNIIKLRKAQ